MDPGWRRKVTVDGRNLALLVGVVLALWASRLHGPIDLRWDAGVYYVLGTSLAEGRGYRLLNEPGEVEAVQYPPALPALVAGVQKAMGTSDSVRVGQALRLLFLAFSLAYVGAGYVLARRLLPPGLSLLAAALVALSFNTLYLSDLCFTEIPFGLVMVLFVLAARSGSVALTGALGVVGFLLRSSGLALLAAWVGEALIGRRLRQAALRAVIAAVPILAWQAHVARVTASPQYRQPPYDYQRAAYQYYNVTYAENLRLVDPFQPERGRLTPWGFAVRVLGNAARVPMRIGEAVSARRGHWQQALRLDADSFLGIATIRVPLLLLGFAVLAGLAGLGWRGEWLVPLVVVASLALMSATPWPPQFLRYLAPLTPLLAVGLCETLDGQGFGRRLSRAVLGPVVVAALAMEVFALAESFALKHPLVEYWDRSGSRASVRLFHYGRDWQSLDEALQWLGARTDPKGVVVTTHPHVAFQRTGRKAVMPPMEADVEEAQRLLDTVPAAYLVIDEDQALDIARRYGEPVVRAHPELWELVYDAGTRIYRRRRKAPLGR